MLQVTIENIDRKFRGLFDTDEPALAVKQALINLVENHRFSQENEILSGFDGDCYGILALPDSIDDSGHPTPEVLEDENTYWITVKTAETGKMFDES